MDLRQNSLIGEPVNNLFGSRKKKKYFAKKLGLKGKKAFKNIRLKKGGRLGVVKKSTPQIKAGTKSAEIKKGYKVSKKGEIVKRTGGVIKKAGELLRFATFVTLLPFKQAVINSMKSKGKYSKGMSDRALYTGFFNEFVSKKNKKESAYDEIPENFFDEHPYFNQDITWDDAIQNNLVDDVASIVNAIIKFFKEKKDKKETKKSLEKKANDAAKSGNMTLAKTLLNEAKNIVLTPLENEQANDAIKVTQKLKSETAKDKPVTVGGLSKFVPYVIGILIIIGLIYFFSK